MQPEIVEEARTACRELRLVGRSRRRDRRPTCDELVRLTEYFNRRDGRAEIPMIDIMNFAIESARRQAEICRLERADNDAQTRSGMVRDAKHPRHKDGNHRRFKYTPEAWAIIERQPSRTEYVFPYNAKSICTAFTRACQIFGIENLHFHDLRHEATSRLFERGYQIHEVAQFTLHDSWDELKRYANLRPENLRDIPLASTSERGRRKHHIQGTSSPSAAAGRSARRGPRRLASSTPSPKYFDATF